MGTVHDIRTAKEITAAPDRSDLGMILSRMSSVLPIDFGIKYDRLSRVGKKAAKVAGSVALLGAAAASIGIISSVVESSSTADNEKLVNAQNAYIIGKHRTVSLEVDGGSAYLRNTPVVTDDNGNKSGELHQGDKVACSIEINRPDGNSWGVVRDEKGNVTFVNINENDAVKVVANPENCPAEVDVSVTGQYPMDRFTVQSATGKIPTFAELIRANQ